MRISYVVFLVKISIVGAASIERRDASPCAVVSQSAAAALSDAIGKLSLAENSQYKLPDGCVATPTVSAQLAYDCLNSVPLGSTEATDLVNSLLPYVEWQSGGTNTKLKENIEKLTEFRYLVLEKSTKGLPRTSNRPLGQI
jgi:hypothetical protein